MNTIPNAAATQSEPIYRVVCAWCPTVLVEGDAGAPVSHGLCHPCDERVRVELAALLAPAVAA